MSYCIFQRIRQRTKYKIGAKSYEFIIYRLYKTNNNNIVIFKTLNFIQGGTFINLKNWLSSGRYFDLQVFMRKISLLFRGDPEIE